MGLQASESISLEAAPDCADTVIPRVKTPDDGVIRVTDRSDSQALGNAGVDLKYFGETERVLRQAPEQVCANQPVRNGSYAVVDELGQACNYSEPDGLCGTERSFETSSSGNGPQRSNAGQEPLIDNISLQVRGSNYPIWARVNWQFCSWEMYPENPRDVAGFIEWNIRVSDFDGEVQEEVTNRCTTGGSGRAPGHNRIGEFLIPPGGVLDLAGRVGLQYFAGSEAFDNNISGFSFYVDWEEKTSRLVPQTFTNC